jgi:hypothetical protein
VPHGNEKELDISPPERHISVIWPASAAATTRLSAITFFNCIPDNCVVWGGIGWLVLRTIRASDYLILQYTVKPVEYRMYFPRAKIVKNIADTLTLKCRVAFLLLH